eukprot:c1722_g1_i1.p2 GENE.c1722_g1_i1~~c1722_g1_i1.p2  ORF type:complete len:109 (+),score=20.87 c1722_g1_i1:36-329(+)
MPDTPLEVPKKVEKMLRQQLIETANHHCHESIAAFAKCASGRTVSVVWACQEQNKAMIECHKPHVTDAKLEELKRQWLEDQLKARQDRLQQTQNQPL